MFGTMNVVSKILLGVAVRFLETMVPVGSVMFMLTLATCTLSVTLALMLMDVDAFTRVPLKGRVSKTFGGVVSETLW